jgi:Ca2+/Na+ antiporter
VPVICPLIQYTAIVKFRKSFSKFIYTALTLYIFLPIITGIIQIFAYGISIVNMTMVLVSVCLYFFTYLDVNAAVEKSHNIEIEAFKEEQKNMKKLFREAASAFAKVQGSSDRMAQVARELAQKAGKSEEECDKVYYAAFLYPAGAEALACIKEFPYLSETAACVGKAYSEDLPEFSRIITVAKDYDTMINDPSNPPFFVRDYLRRKDYVFLHARKSILRKQLCTRARQRARFFRQKSPDRHGQKQCL